MNGGNTLLIDLCLAMRSDPVGVIRGLKEVVTCFYGPAVTYAFPDPLVAAYRNSVVHVSLISVLDGTAPNWCRQEVLRARMSNTVLFGKVKDPDLVEFIFRGQLQCRMGGKREGPIETYPKMADGRTGNLDNPRVEKEFRFGEEGARSNARERNPAHHYSRVLDSPENDLGDE